MLVNLVRPTRLWAECALLGRRRAGLRFLTWNGGRGIMTGEIVCVGTELLLGDIINTDAAYAARRLAELGIGVYFQTVVGDNPERLKAALAQAFARADLVILTGGLGPTGDDITKEVTAAYFGLPLIEDRQAAENLKRYLSRAGVPCTENNAKQALIPAGAHVFYNQNGTAPGMAIRKDGKTAILLPGPPREMEPMFDTQVMPYLAQELDGTIRSHALRLFGIGEAQVEQRLPAALWNSSNPTLAPYAKNGEVELRVTARGSSPEDCEAAMEPVLQILRSKLDRFIYGLDVPDMQTVLVHELQTRKLTIATAESLTGGLLSERLTQVPGASEVFGLGVCAYANGAKEKLLGVSAETLSAHGAVSAQTAAEMAAGIRRLADADIGVSTTGIAGPTGGTPEKPVGTVFVGIASDAGMKILPLALGRPGRDQRTWIRHATALHAFSAVLQLIAKGNDADGR